MSGFDGMMFLQSLEARVSRTGGQIIRAESSERSVAVTGYVAILAARGFRARTGHGIRATCLKRHGTEADEGTRTLDLLHGKQTL